MYTVTVIKSDNGFQQEFEHLLWQGSNAGLTLSEMYSSVPTIVISISLVRSQTLSDSVANKYSGSVQSTTHTEGTKATKCGLDQQVVGCSLTLLVELACILLPEICVDSF